MRFERFRKNAFRKEQQPVYEAIFKNTDKKSRPEKHRSPQRMFGHKNHTQVQKLFGF